MLLSNSSMKFYPDNKTTHFVTKLPRHVELMGKWFVALVEIQIPLTFQHVPSSSDQRKIDLYTDTDEKKIYCSTEFTWKRVYTVTYRH